ncbi:serine endopeptidase [Silvibacterium dinghuense]|uniref:Serine endopeptidase n=1 Tax=Silvibacterium dinghuense TaxID=1560006 RepID=A0A4Q1SBN4_9BACT|nr:serine endopeptidase [Silvibacterium dinghuense]RXS94548.1 serine endopeptidase [Silvibacterium dinghuense]GGH15434.1 hypothetical protein GCM10011586_36510 [Silvibacterium dinghuense]
MSKLRLSEKWFQRGLWLIAVLFGGFLVGLGRLVVSDLPSVVPPRSVDSYVDQSKVATVQQLLAKDQAALDDNQKLLDQATAKYEHAQQESSDAHDTFQNWIATRQATGQSNQDAEVIKRTRQLDDLKANEQKLQEDVDHIQKQRESLLKPQQEHQAVIDQAQADAQVLYDKEMHRVALHVFLMRLAFTLPLLLVAWFLFLKARKSSQWPFVWGFIFFALFTFFVELVPYLPSYGGYVRYIVGIVVTVLCGSYAIRALRRYLEQQKLAEQLPEEERRKDLGYDTAQLRLVKGVCPGCERPFDVADTKSNYCMHCGLLVYIHCPQCDTRQTAFSRFCRTCGAIKANASTDAKTVQG